MAGVLRVLTITVGLAIAILGAFVSFQNLTYARTLFTDIVAYDRVLYSRRWHALFGGPFNCSYAVVSLREAASKEPPEESIKGRNWQFRWGGEWQATPAQPTNPNRHNGIDCINRFDTETAARITTALEQPGSWYVRSAAGLLYIYSHPQGIAARMRYGD